MPSVNKATEAPTAANGQDAAALAAWTDRFFTANREAAGTAGELAKEMMEFAARRMRAQMEFVSAMPKIGDVNGVMEAQFRYLERASQDYVEEFGVVSQVLLRAANGASGEPPKAN